MLKHVTVLKIQLTARNVEGMFWNNYYSNTFQRALQAVTLIRMSLFWAAHGWVAKSPNLLHTFHNVETWHSYTLPKEDSENIQITRHTPRVLLILAFFSPEISNFCNIGKYRPTFHFNTQVLILLIFSESLRIISIIEILILMMSAKVATPGLKINVL